MPEGGLWGVLGVAPTKTAAGVWMFNFQVRQCLLQGQRGRTHVVRRWVHVGEHERIRNVRQGWARLWYTKVRRKKPIVGDLDPRLVSLPFNNSFLSSFNLL